MEIRKFVCLIKSKTKTSPEYEPLPMFNDLLDKVAEISFREGIEFGKKYPDLYVQVSG